MAIGFAAKKFKAVDAVFLRGLSSFMVNIALPFAFLVSLDRGIPKRCCPSLEQWLYGLSPFMEHR